MAKARCQRSPEEDRAMVPLVPPWRDEAGRNAAADVGRCRRGGAAAPQGLRVWAGKAVPGAESTDERRALPDCAAELFCLAGCGCPPGRGTLHPLSLLSGRSSCDRRHPRPSTMPFAFGRLCSMMRAYLLGTADKERTAGVRCRWQCFGHHQRQRLGAQLQRDFGLVLKSGKSARRPRLAPSLHHWSHHIHHHV